VTNQHELSFDYGRHFGSAAIDVLIKQPAIHNFTAHSELRAFNQSGNAVTDVGFS
jgi:hypothetical protein